MTTETAAWDSNLVRRWLEGRLAAARLEQAAADRRGYGAEGDYDKAAGEEWVSRALLVAGRTDEQAGLAGHIKQLLAQEEYRVAGIHDDRRFDRAVRAQLRKIAKMVKTNDGFGNLLRYQD